MGTWKSWKLPGAATYGTHVGVQRVETRVVAHQTPDSIRSAPDVHRIAESVLGGSKARRENRPERAGIPELESVAEQIIFRYAPRLTHPAGYRRVARCPRRARRRARIRDVSDDVRPVPTKAANSSGLSRTASIPR